MHVSARSTYVDDIYLHDIPSSHSLVFPEITCYMGTPKEWYVRIACPLCHEERWLRKTYVTSNNKKTTYCSRHRNVSLLHWAIPGEFDHREDIRVDYAQQKASESAKASGKRVVFIWGTCPHCDSSRWVRVTGLRHTSNTTICISCGKKAETRLRPTAKPSGGRTSGGGYIFVHIDVLAKQYSPEDMALIQTYLRSSEHRRYYPEHRVVALLKYGPLFFADDKKTVVRHINGQKHDNRPENILIGSQTENIQDHVTDRKLAKKWQGIATELAKIVHLLLLAIPIS